MGQEDDGIDWGPEIEIVEHADFPLEALTGKGSFAIALLPLRDRPLNIRSIPARDVDRWPSG
jgi:hypothetical protein